MTDPENTVRERQADFAEDEVNLLDEFERELPAEADDADAVEQKLDIPADDDEYDR